MLRPIRPMLSSSSMKSGRAVSSSPNSSMTSSRWGIGVRSGFSRRRAAYSVTLATSPASLSNRCRRRTSPARLACARSIRPTSSSRLVIIPATCGSPANGANAAPPLKSTRTRLRSSGGWVAARPSTRVRSSSLLPEPVAPTHSPCGPMPSCADSFRSRWTGWPASSTPIATRRKSRSSRGRHHRATSAVVGSPIPSRRGEVRRSRACGAGRARGLGGQPQGRERAGEAVCGGAVDVVQPAHRGGAVAQVVDPDPVAVHGDPDVHLRRLVQAVGDQMDVRDTEPGRIRGIRYDGVRAVRVVQHDEPAGTLRAVRRTAFPLGEAGPPARELPGEHGGEAPRVRRDPPLAGRLRGGGADVRQPLQPLPLDQPVGAERHRERHVVGRVEHGELGDEGTRRAQHTVPVADDADRRGVPERHDHGHVAGRAEPAHHRAGLGQHERVGRRQGGAAVVQGQPRPGYAAATDPQPQEVGIVGAALPQPPRVAHDVDQCRRRRIEHVGAVARPGLVGGERLAQALEVVEVALALLAALPGGLPALRQEQPEAAQRGDDEQDRAHGDERAATQDGHHHQRGQQPGDRQQGVRGATGLTVGQRRRRLDRAGRAVGQVQGRPRRPVDHGPNHGHPRRPVRPP